MANVDTTQHDEFFKSKVLGHPAGLFVLFFTEMWERFSFYGMRVLLINFLTMAVIGSNPGWEWTAENAGALFGTYAGLLYLTPILGGVIADKFTGYRWAVLIGCVIMTAGHASMAFETEFSLYMGLALLVLGTGFFKPNITSIISEMYTYLPEKKDGAYTIFYMGVNAGAFFGMMLCGYLAERVGWSWGFGLAGIFMLFGTVQFLLAKPLFGKIGAPPVRQTKEEKAAEVKDYKENKFTMVDKVLIVVTAIIGLLYLINDPVSKIGEVNLLPEEFFLSKDTLSGPLVIVLGGLLLFLYLIITRIRRYEKVIRDRMIAVIIFAFFTVLFFIPFEQAATSMVIFARDYTDRVLTGNSALIFNIVNTLLTIIPLMIITWVLYLLNKKSFKKIPGSNVVLALCFSLVWGIVIWMLARDFNTVSYEAQYAAVPVEQIANEKGEYVYEAFSNDEVSNASNNDNFKVGSLVAVRLGEGDYVSLDTVKNNKVVVNYQEEREDLHFALGNVKNADSTHFKLDVTAVRSQQNFPIYKKKGEAEADEKTYLSAPFMSNNTNAKLSLGAEAAYLLDAPGSVKENSEVAVQRDQKSEIEPVRFAYGEIVENANGEISVSIDTVLVGKQTIVYQPVSEARPLLSGEETMNKPLFFSTNEELKVGDNVATHVELGKFVYLDGEKENKLAEDYVKAEKSSKIIQASVSEIKDNEVEITVSWFSILNSFFIIAFASFFSKWWESKYNPSAAMKYSLGLIVMGIGFAVLAYGSSFIPQGTEAGIVRVSMVWLILAYFFHTLGELFLSPVGLSYVSKLVPARMIALMFGMWYLAIAIGNKIAASMGGMVDEIQEEYSISFFFLIFTIIPVVAGVLIAVLNPLLKKLMHGVK